MPDIKIIKACREDALVIDLSLSHSITNVKGTDRLKFLQAMVTNDLNKLKKSELQLNCLCSRKGMVTNEFGVFENEEEDQYELLHTVSQDETLSNSLEQFLFAEDVEVQNQSKKLYLLTGTKASQYLEDSQSKAYQMKFSGESSFLIILEANQNLPKTLKELPLAHYGADQVEWLRIQGGVLDYDKDLEGCLLNNTNLLDCYVDHDKGCYPGQEIITRIHQRGKPAQLLRTIECTGKLDLRLPFELSEKTKKVAQITSFAYHSEEDISLAFAYIKTPFYEEINESYDWVHNRKKREFTLLKTPCFHSPNLIEQALKTYETGILKYHDNQYAEAKSLFEMAIELSPDYADAWEALGMVAEKQNLLDDAIGYNQKLIRKAPESVMGYTNLSRLYMLKGWINKAEEQQQKAQDVYFKMQQKKQPLKTISIEAIEEQNQRLQAEREKKKAIFYQVLEIDPEDEIAHFGLGKMFCDQLHFDKAEPHLEKLLQFNPMYSAAWPLLVKTYLGLEKLDMADEAIHKGLEITQKTGDLMPGKQLEILKRKLNKTS